MKRLFAILALCAAAGVAGAARADQGSIQLIAGGALVSAGNPLPVQLKSGSSAIGIVGNAGAILDAPLGASTAPIDGLAVLCQYNSSLPTLASGQTAAVQCDPVGRPYVVSIGVGATPFKLIAANSTNSTNIKASGGQIYHMDLSNNSATPAYLKLYDSATAPTCGSGTPVSRIMLPANTTISPEIATGISFANGIGLCLTGGIADADTTAVAASTYLVNIVYK